MAGKDRRKGKWKQCMYQLDSIISLGEWSGTVIGVLSSRLC